MENNFLFMEFAEYNPVQYSGMVQLRALPYMANRSWIFGTIFRLIKLR